MADLIQALTRGKRRPGKKRKKEHKAESAVKAVLSVFRVKKHAPLRDRKTSAGSRKTRQVHGTADPVPQKADPVSQKTGQVPHMVETALPAEFPEDIRSVLELEKQLRELDDADAYIPHSRYEGLVRAHAVFLQELFILQEKELLEYYCSRNGLSAAQQRSVEEMLLLCREQRDGAENRPAEAECRTAETENGTVEAERGSAESEHRAAEEENRYTEAESRPAAEKNAAFRKSSLDEVFRVHNEKYLAHALESEREYLDHVLDRVDPRIRLDEAQRRMVLTDEDNCLVIAGAGAGKTTSVAAKVKYLVDRKGIRPEEILVISFTNKAVDELRSRIRKDLGIQCPICTFHSAGNAVLHMQDPERINIVDADKKFFVIRDYFRGKVLRDERLTHSLILFFASYFDAPLNERDLESFFRGIAQVRYTSMRSELDEYCAEIIDAQKKRKVTIRSEIMRSSQEVEIANFLYRNGIDYVYEPVYRYHIERAHKPYTPDFLIRQGEREIWLEHFGITRDGRNSRYDEARLRAYKDAVNDKVRLHRQHGTELIYTFSGYGDGRSLTEHLEEELRAHGVAFHPRPDEEILQKILQNEGNRYVRRLVELICRFITNFKTDGYTEMQFAIMRESTNNVRTKLFLEICQACFLEYQRVLRELQAVDFEDMINESARSLRECSRLKQRLGFKYIIVDEYQDISRQRFDLTKALREVSDAKVIAVGDDWQSIYAFSGADLTLFTQFQEKMGPAAMLRIENTYRNAQELIDIAGSFIQKNPTQITKTLHSAKRIQDPVLIFSYDASQRYLGKGRKSGPNYNMGRAVEAALDHIAEKRREEGKPKEVKLLLLGRYNYDGYKLEKTDLFEYRGKGAGRRIISKKYPYMQITFMTVHSSKGLGYDEVIVVNGQGGTYGFPSKIEDDPVLSLVLREDRTYTYAEERRLFYVALTRTKNRVYLIAPQQEPSEFLLELLRDFRNVRLDAFSDQELEEREKEAFFNRSSTGIAMGRKVCPICGYPLQLRYKVAYGLRLYLCTNDTEICGFMTNDLRGGRMSILKCDCCADGYLTVHIRRKDGSAFLGCTNFRKDRTGCRRTMGWPEYQQKMRFAPGYGVS